jgi:hypothetical protein
MVATAERRSDATQRPVIGSPGSNAGVSAHPLLYPTGLQPTRDELLLMEEPPSIDWFETFLYLFWGVVLTWLFYEPISSTVASFVRQHLPPGL